VRSSTANSASRPARDLTEPITGTSLAPGRRTNVAVTLPRRGNHDAGGRRARPGMRVAALEQNVARARSDDRWQIGDRVRPRLAPRGRAGASSAGVCFLPAARGCESAARPGRRLPGWLGDWFGGRLGRDRLRVACCGRTKLTWEAAAASCGGLWVLCGHNPPRERGGGLFWRVVRAAPPGRGTRRRFGVPDARNQALTQPKKRWCPRPPTTGHPGSASSVGSWSVRAVLGFRQGGRARRGRVRPAAAASRRVRLRLRPGALRRRVRSPTHPRAAGGW
jgi:hypothetical protein